LSIFDICQIEKENKIPNYCGKTEISNMPVDLMLQKINSKYGSDDNYYCKWTIENLDTSKTIVIQLSSNV
jgi:hypothetical protein